jgi:HAD superfamily hydrolase (TIGR01458 family)
MNTPKVLLIDLDGTLYFRGIPIRGAEKAISELRDMGFIMRFLSNTDSKSVSSIQKSLHSMGLQLPLPEIFTPAVALKQFAKERSKAKFHLLLSQDLMSVLQNELEIGNDTADYVVVGDIRESVSYSSLDKAFRLIMGGSEIIAMQKGRYFEASDGKHLDTGGFVRLLEYASGKESIVLGKPSKDFFNLALKSCGCTYDEAVIIGDDLNTDIKGAKTIGSLAIQVRTGKAAENVLSPSNPIPDLVINSIIDLPDILRLGFPRKLT